MTTTVVYKCGHTGEIRLIGKTAERENTIRAAEQQKCPDCIQADRLADLADDVANGWADLEGTRQHRAFGSWMREDKIAEAQEIITKNGLAAYEPMLKEATQIKSARWWAKNSFKTWHGIISAGAEQMAYDHPDQVDQSGWAVLNGSPKQVGWAEHVRLRKLGGAQLLVDADQKENYSSKKVLARQVATVKALEGNTDSKWWINHHNDDIDLILAWAVTMIKETKE